MLLTYLSELWLPTCLQAQKNMQNILINKDQVKGNLKHTENDKQTLENNHAHTKKLS